MFLVLDGPRRDDAVDAAARCPACDAVTITEFGLATFDQIVAAGLQRHDFE